MTTRCPTLLQRRPSLPASPYGALVMIAALSALAPAGHAETYHVSLAGSDTADRDGLSADTAWRSLAYACQRVAEGDHRIQLGPGTFRAEQTARPKSGVAIVGKGSKGKDATRILAAESWPLSENPADKNPRSEYLIALTKVKDVSIASLVLASTPEHRITGAVYCSGSEKIILRDLRVHDFRWGGLHLEFSQGLDLSECRIENASTDKFRYHGGLIRTRWIKHSRIHHNRITSTIGGGYGYKGSGHEDVRLDHNFIDVVGGFAIESAHENEYGVQIDHNYATRCISVPKGGQGDDPNSRGHEYSFWIHHNHLTDSYTIEGPRNHLRVSHNYIHIEKPNGRVYTHHGGKNHGPVWLHHNVIENVDRAVVWMNEGLAENIYVYNNTIFCADAGARTGAILGAYTAERLNHWVFRNNIVVAAWSRPRPLFPLARGVPTKITATSNLCINVTDVPDGNFVDTRPGLRREGPKPWPFYLPADAGSFVVDRGADVGLPFTGKAPDLGAYELGAEQPLTEIPSTK